jgi:hypothetical protein
MTKHSGVPTVAIVVLLIAGMTASSASAQTPAPSQKPAAQPAPQPTAQDSEAAQRATQAREAAAAREVIPLQAQIVISKFQGEKKVSSVPYVLSMNSSNQREGASLRMGTQVAIPSTSTNDGKTVSSYSYRDIGTNIDCSAIARPDGSFNVVVTVSESSVYADDKQTPNVTGLPVLRSFQTTNRLILKDGQNSQFTAATDRVSGEIVRIDITLKVVK